MTFDSDKKNCMLKMISMDKSRKKSIDKEIIPILNIINNNNNFYTTSSCSGRIYLLTESKNNKKHEVKWLYVSHIPIKSSEIINVLSKDLPCETIWFRQEGMILHVACRSINSANNLLQIARITGFRRSGIISDNKRIIVEICSTEKMDVPIANKSVLLVNQDFIKFIVKKANKKFKINQEKMNNFYHKLKYKINNL
ncbi:MAG: tRNA wybutosine-synthesizing 3 family protein [Candidatus Woesearchaeota archaeon]